MAQHIRWKGAWAKPPGHLALGLMPGEAVGSVGSSRWYRSGGGGSRVGGEAV